MEASNSSETLRVRLATDDGENEECEATVDSDVHSAVASALHVNPVTTGLLIELGGDEIQAGVTFEEAGIEDGARLDVKTAEWTGKVHKGLRRVDYDGDDAECCFADGLLDGASLAGGMDLREAIGTLNEYHPTFTANPLPRLELFDENNL